MRLKLSAVTFCWISVVALAQTLGRSHSQAVNQVEQEQQLQIRRENFTSGRQLLLDKGVTFNPDDLLRDDWVTRLKPTLDAMPEMHQARRETAPLSGAYFADTIYLPENVRLLGHTLILANYVVFEGKNPSITGNFDLNFFPAKPVVVLDTSLAEAIGKKGRFLGAKLRNAPWPPSFSLIQDPGSGTGHRITFDTSPQKAQQPSQKSSAGQLRAAGWDARSALFQSQNTSGDTGTTGSSGTPGTAGTNAPNEPVAVNGDCNNPSGGTNNGANGANANVGGTGGNGGQGGQGGVGGNAGNINATVADGDTNLYSFIANGGSGGLGGQGGNGGVGGNGGNGGTGGNGVACGCSVGSGGGAGSGGNGHPGGQGGNGGTGGTGGNGGSITVSLPWNSPGANTSNSGGAGGLGGNAGAGGGGGLAGLAGSPGTGATACGQTGATGPSATGGQPGSAGNSGNAGPNGAAGQAGPTPNVTFREQPGGGGGCGTGGGGDGGYDPNCSPIIIDVEGEGFHLTSAFNGVTFDMSGTGHPAQMGWTDAHYHNAFLALPGTDGLVHTGKELFGNFTPQPPSAHPNGFIALAQYDKPESGGNGDGIIDDRDEVFSKLRLWIDENHDGVCQPSELHRLPEFGIYSLALSYTESRRKDEWGNQFRYKAQVNPGDRKDPRDETRTGDLGRWTYDVFFVFK